MSSRCLGADTAEVHVVIRPARVQGDGAAATIADGIRAIGRVPGVDVIIVGRGGGSIEDLWAFNGEVVARAISTAPVPVISAVGHESDVTLADLVADVRAPTPSAAAEIVVAAEDEFRGRIDRLHGRLHAAADRRVQALSRFVQIMTLRPALAGVPGRLAMRSRHAAELSLALVRAAQTAVDHRERRLQRLQHKLDACGLGRRLAAIRTTLVRASGHLAGAMARRHHQSETQLGDLASRLDALSPLAVLGRGYAVCWNRDRTAVIREAAETAPGDRVRVTLSKGELDCEVRDSKS